MDHQGAKAFILLKLRKELPAQRTYHCLEHTLDVYASVIDIAEKEHVAGEDLLLLKTAALFHDVGFTVQDLDHEEAGCRIARAELPRFGYSPDQVERIGAMIMATRIPHDPHDLVSMILCDADLDYLGRNDFTRVGATLFEELKAYGVLSTELEWDTLQVRFLEEHRFFTRTSQVSRDPLKRRHLEQLRDRLKELGGGG